MRRFDAIVRRIGNMRGNLGRASWNNGVTNTGLARRVFGRWVDRLRDFLDSNYST
jgi:hypothetical protein